MPPQKSCRELIMQSLKERSYLEFLIANPCGGKHLRMCCQEHFFSSCPSASSTENQFKVKKRQFSFSENWRFLFNACLLTIHYCFCQLVGTACAFAATQITRKFFGNFFSRHSIAQNANSFQVAVTAAFKANIADYITVTCKVNDFCTRASGFIRNFFHV